MFKFNTSYVRRRRMSGMGKYKSKCKKLGSIYVNNDFIGKKVCIVEHQELNKFIKKYKLIVREFKKIEKIVCNINK